jgi:hypothetical protein
LIFVIIIIYLNFALLNLRNNHKTIELKNF